MAKRSKSSERWLQRQRKDYFVRQAQGGGQVSRAHFKLEQIDQRFRIIKPKQRVLELGAAPGGWTHYLEGKLQGGLLIAVDPLPITSSQDTYVIEGLAGDQAVNEEISTILRQPAIGPCFIRYGPKYFWHTHSGSGASYGLGGCNL